MLLTDGAKPEETFVTIVDTEGEIHVEHYQIDSLLGHEFQDVFGIGCGEDLLESSIEQVTFMGANLVQVESRELVLCRDAAKTRRFRLQSYNFIVYKSYRQVSNF